MRAHFIFIISLFALISCSGKAPVKTGFEIRLEGLPAASTYGGLIIFGKSGTQSFSRVLANGVGSVVGSAVEELPKNTTWEIGAVAWLGSEAFTGEIRCSFGSHPIGDADTATINLSLTNQRCFDAGVALPSTYTGAVTKVFETVTSSFCEGDISTRSNAICDYSETLRPVEKGFAGSYQFIVSGIKGEILQSKCYRAGTDDEPAAAPTYSTATLNIPAFDPALAVPLKVQAYLSSDCDATMGSMLLSLSNPAEARIDFNSPGGNFLYARTPAASLCTISDTQPTALAPASGNGTMVSPFLICSEAQLLALQKNYAGTFGLVNAKEGVYVLGRDLNLMKFVQFETLTTPAHQCLGMGDTFVPIGKAYDGYPSCVLNPVASHGSFRFDGNSHTISHFRFKSSSENDVGFLSTLSGKIYDVKFDLTEIESADNAGAVAGYTTGGMIKNVKVTNSFIEGGNNTGGIAGNVNGSTALYMIFGESLDVEGFSQTGRLFGKINTGALNDASFDGSVYASNGSMYVGGIVGQMSGTSIDNVASKGILRGAAIKMGGIAGASSSISFARSEMYIKDYDSNPSGTRYIGGIVGFQSASITNKSYFDGTIVSECITGCNIGAIAGDGGVPTDTFSTFPDPALGGQAGDDVTFDTDDVFIGNNLSAAMCSIDPGCQWSQIAGGKPLLVTFEGVGKEPTCSKSPNTLSLSAQAVSPYLRGSIINPLVICRPDQFKDIPNFPGKSFVLEDHLNLNAFLSSDMGSFFGRIDGKQHYIHSFWDLASTGDASLFTTIDSNSEIKNLQAVGFRIKATSCSTACKMGALALDNDGEIINVRVQDVSIEALNNNTQSGGLVSYNNGQIHSSRVDGDMKSNSSMGGMVYHNVGSIEHSLSDVYIDGQDHANTMYIGGIAGSSDGVISRSKFRGEITGLATGIYVGGIAGISVAGSFSENEFNEEARIFPGSGSQSVGGIVGYIPTAGFLTRNLSKGSILSLSNNNVKSLVGSGTYTNTNNYRVTVPGDRIQTGVTSTASFNAGSGMCIATVSGSVGFASIPGIFKIGDDIYHGELADGAAIYNFYTKTKDAATCSLLNSVVDVYLGTDTKDSFSIAALKSASWDIGDLAGTATDKARVFATYKAWLTDTDPVSPPVWLNDPDEEGLGLFLRHD